MVLGGWKIDFKALRPCRRSEGDPEDFPLKSFRKTFPKHPNKSPQMVSTWTLFRPFWSQMSPGAAKLDLEGPKTPPKGAADGLRAPIWRPKWAKGPPQSAKWTPDGALGATLGSLWAPLGGLWGALGDFWGPFGHLWASLWTLLV